MWWQLGLVVVGYIVLGFVVRAICKIEQPTGLAFWLHDLPGWLAGFFTALIFYGS